MLRIIPLILLLCLVLTGCEDLNKPKVAFVDTVNVFNNTEAGKKATAFLQEQAKQIESTLNNIVEAINKDPDNEELKQYFQAVQVILQRRMQAEQQNTSNTFNTAMSDVLKDYRAEHKLSHIISTQTTLVYDSNLDITKQVIELLDKRSISYSVAGQYEALPPMPQTSGSNNSEPTQPTVPTDEAQEATPE